MSTKQISEIIQKKSVKFLDLEFPPTDHSIFDTHIDSPFDIFVHWRRPEEFLKPNYELGTLKCVVF